MTDWWVPALLGLAVVAVLVALAWRPVRAKLRERDFAQPARISAAAREHLEAKFMQLASQSGKPRGLEWVRCDFEDDVIYAPTAAAVRSRPSWA